MKKLRKIFIGIILILIITTLTGCEEDSGEIEKQKALSEIEYVEERITYVVENFLNEKYTEDDKLKWSEIKDDFEEVADSTSVMIVDLTSLNFDDDIIMEFENRVNSVNTAISNEGNIAFLKSLSDLYELIPKYVSEIYPEDTNLYLEKSVNEELLKSVYFCMIDDFETGLQYVETAEDNYKSLMSDTSFMSEKSYIANKIYVAIQEMKLAVQNQELENVISKYVNTN